MPNVLRDYIASHSFDHMLAPWFHCLIHVISASLHSMLQQERLVIQCLLLPLNVYHMFIVSSRKDTMYCCRGYRRWRDPSG